MGFFRKWLKIGFLHEELSLLSTVPMKGFYTCKRNVCMGTEKLRIWTLLSATRTELEFRDFGISTDSKFKHVNLNLFEYGTIKTYFASVILRSYKS